MGEEYTGLREYLLRDKNLLQRFDDVRSLGGTASQQFPRILALRAGIELRKGEILSTKKKIFLDVVGDSGPGLNCALSTLNADMGVIDDSYLPFKDVIALIGATYSARWAQVRNRVVAFLWTVCLVEDWDSGTNDKTRAAFRQLTGLLEDRSAPAEIVLRLERGFPEFEDVRNSTSKASIIFRTLMAFNLARGGIDWADVTRFANNDQEDHHIFPRDWLANNREEAEDKHTWASLRDSVLNRIFVSKAANSVARAQTPPNYLGKLTIEQLRLLQLPESFLGPLHTPIKSEVFSALLRERYELIKKDFIHHVRQNLRSARAN